MIEIACNISHNDDVATDQEIANIEILVVGTFSRYKTVILSTIL